MRPPPSAPHTRPAPQPADAPPCPPRCAGRARPAAYEKLTRRFAREWTERNGGRKLYFRLSFGGSGTQTRAIIDGLPVDIFSPALEADLLKVEDEEYLDAGWQARLPNRGIVAETVIVLVTRPGNPKNVRDWADLARPEVTTVTPNPKTGGGARWNFLALWGSIVSSGGSHEQAYDFCDRVLLNTAALPRDSREAADMFFNQNTGDVLVTYENEAILSNENRKTGQESFPYIVPARTVCVEAPCIAVIDRNVDRRGREYREVADEFVRYLFTDEAQRELQATGFRSINKRILRESKLPKVRREGAPRRAGAAADSGLTARPERALRPRGQARKLWTVGSVFGDWRKINAEYFDTGGFADQILASISTKRIAANAAG